MLSIYKILATIILSTISLNSIYGSSNQYNECIIDQNNKCEPSLFNNQETLVFPGGNTICIHDDIQDSPVSKYKFQVFPGDNANKNKLLIYFQGGGACSNDAQCSRNNSLAIFKKNAGPVGSKEGIFNNENPSNPFRGFLLLIYL